MQKKGHEPFYSHAF